MNLNLNNQKTNRLKLMFKPHYRSDQKSVKTKSHKNIYLSYGLNL